MKTRCDHCGRMFGLKRYPDVCTWSVQPQFCSKFCLDTYKANWERQKRYLKWLYGIPDVSECA